MKYIEIDPNTWLCGEGSSGSKLYRSSDKKMCCLGFAAVQSGCSIESIKNVASPIDLDLVNLFKLKDLNLMYDGLNSTPLLSSLININDSIRNDSLEQRLNNLNFALETNNATFRFKFKS